ncbi:MAG: response regulator transcription factor [Marinicaulis sp.]|nr:response regulator [Marinicaulis sp.]NNE40720.1 response regulator transcription factor [Marinicaulis sp.]NNL87666.1 response regulator transcription factor [Marinicaulis sp.]
MTDSSITNDRAVFLVDDDVAVRRGVAALLSAAEYETTTFKSGEEFLSALPDLELANAVMLVDVCMPGIQGLELQEQLNKDGVDLPVIVMTAHGDIPMAVRAMQNGAIDFLQKPFTVDEVTTALERALSVSPRRQSPLKDASPELRSHHQSLTPRENDVFREIVGGNTNKEIARILAISPRTVEVHRQKIMSKMEAENLAELVRMAVTLNIGE